MRTLSYIFGIASVVLCAVVAAAIEERPVKAIGATSELPGSLVFMDEPHARFADAYQGSVIEWSYGVRNDGAVPVVIEEAVAIRQGASVTSDRDTLEPGEAATVSVRQPLEDDLGQVSYRYALVTDEPGVARYRFSLSGFVQSAFDPERPGVDVGRVDRAKGGSAEIELGSREVRRLEVRRLTGIVPPHLRLQTSQTGIADEKVRLVATVLPGAPLGITFAKLGLETNVPNQPTVSLWVRAEVFGDVVPSEHPIALGLVHVGAETEKQIVISSRTETPFRLASIEDSRKMLNIDYAPCNNVEPDVCYLIRLKVRPDEAGLLGGVLDIRMDDVEEVLPLTYSGVAVPEGTRVERIDLEGSVESAPVKDGGNGR